MIDIETFVAQPVQVGAFIAVSALHWLIALFLIFGLVFIRSKKWLKIYAGFAALVFFQKITVGCVLTHVESSLLRSFKDTDTYKLTDLPGVSTFLQFLYPLFDVLGLPRDEEGYETFSNAFLVVAFSISLVMLLLSPPSK